MATGIEMMVSALLKAVGFSREQFDGTLNVAKTEFDAMKRRAENAEQMLTGIAKSQAAIMSHLGMTPETADTRQGVLSLVSNQSAEPEKGN